MRYDVIRTIEACYSPAADDEAWLHGVLETMASLEDGMGLYAYVIDVSTPGKLVMGAQSELGGMPPWRESMRCSWSAAPPEVVRAAFAPHPPVDLATRRVRVPHAKDTPGEFFLQMPTSEALGVLAIDADQRGLNLGALKPIGYRPPPQLVHQLWHVSAHLLSGARLRGICGPPPSPERSEPEAVLDSAGRVHHATRAAESPEVRALLGDAVKMTERARGPVRRTSPEEAVQLWRGLIGGEWSLVDNVESDGRRYVLARRNDPAVRDPKALTARERDVAAFAALGHSNKYIGYTLGLEPSTIAKHLESAQRKLALASRQALIDFFGGPAGDPAGEPRDADELGAER